MPPAPPAPRSSSPPPSTREAGGGSGRGASWSGLLTFLLLCALAVPALAKPPPLPTDPALDAKAKALFDGIRDDDPAQAMAFFMPEDQFREVKGIADPDHYWRELTAWYGDDVHRLHRSLPDLAGARYLSFALSKDVRWTPPGKEWNKGAYHSVRNSVLAWVGKDGVRHDTVVRVVIDWKGAWWVTHLRWPQEGARADLAKGRKDHEKAR